MIEIILPDLRLKIIINIEALPPTPPASAAFAFSEADYEQRKTA